MELTENKVLFNTSHQSPWINFQGDLGWYLLGILSGKKGKMPEYKVLFSTSNQFPWINFQGELGWYLLGKLSRRRGGTARK